MHEITVRHRTHKMTYFLNALIACLSQIAQATDAPTLVGRNAWVALK